ncbi:MAG: hypothetical protein JWN02_2207, partial [Acidobacteria bacterium]|nr:hypothetical protein [Acidobacteriota bacterium]
SSPYLGDGPLHVPPRSELFIREAWWGQLETPWLSGGIAAAPLSEEVWSHSAEQLDFRERVLAAHIERTRKRRGAAQRDLRDDELRKVRGTGISMRPDAADAASLLIEAANVALAAAREGGDPDALRTTRISASSGYREKADQHRLWLLHFEKKYYNRTQEAREALPAGPHSAAAVSYLLDRSGYNIPKRTAAPGYSNHQAGIAVDLRQDRTAGHEIANDTDENSRGKWRASWLHKWLVQNAAHFDFVPLASEEWHWEYKPASARAHSPAPAVKTPALPKTPPPAAGPAGQTFYSAIDLKIGTVKVELKIDKKPATTYVKVKPTTGIFVPERYRAGAVVDLVIYLHGFTVGYPGREVSIDGYWADRHRYFALREQVNDSGKNVILVAPTLGPRSQAGSLDDAGGLDVFVATVLEKLVLHLPAFRDVDPQIGNIILAAHSGGGAPMRKIALSGSPAAKKVRECWLFDALYGGVSDWGRWARAQAGHGSLYSYYATKDPTTNSLKLERDLREAGLTNTFILSAATAGVARPGHFDVVRLFFAERLRDTAWLQDRILRVPQPETFDALEGEDLPEGAAEEQDREAVETEGPEDEESAPQLYVEEEDDSGPLSGEELPQEEASADNAC